MGLDMYLAGKKNVYDKNIEVEGEKIRRVEIDVCYWRGEWKLQGLIRGVLDDYVDGDIENCKDYEVYDEHLTQLIDLIQGGAIAEYTEENITSTITQLNKALELKRKGWGIVYYAWW